MRITARIAVNKYPNEPIHVMPTALGNTLRRHEMLAGAAVGLPVLSWATHIGLVPLIPHTTATSMTGALKWTSQSG